MDTIILNPENATYYCHPGCGDCCCYGIPLYPSEAWDISKNEGIPLDRLVGIKKGQIALRRKNLDSADCIFFDKSRNCRLHGKDYQPYVCQVYPLRFKTRLSEGRITINLEERHKICNNGRNELVVPEEQLIQLAEKGIKMKVAERLAGKSSDVRVLCEKSFEHLNSLSIEDAVQQAIRLCWGK